MANASIKIGPVQKNHALIREPFEPNIRVAAINDYLLCFYDGREIEGYPAWLHTNIDMQLGLCCYVVHRGEKAIIFDTMLYKEQMIWIDRYIRNMGIKTVSVINSHWDCDHIAGNYLYKSCDIISTENTRWSIAMHADVLRSGEIWTASGDPNYPGIDDLVLPNRTFAGEMSLYLEDIRIELKEVFAHQLGSLVAYFPKDKILLAADACEDTVLFIGGASIPYLPIQVMTYKKLLSLDIDRIYPSHGRFEIIEGGGYGKDFLSAMLDYKVQMIERLPEPDYLEASLESFVGKWVDKGVLSIHEPYRWLHDFNVNGFARYYANKSIPAIPDY